MKLDEGKNLLPKSCRGIVANLQGFNIIVYEFELQSRYYVYFQINTLGKHTNSFIAHHDYWLYSAPTVILLRWFLL